MSLHETAIHSRLKLPHEVPVFPLPETILFPGVEIPLYIFEPRYRRMLKDCYSGSKMMAVSLFRPGWQAHHEPIPSYDVVGVGYIRVMIENADGTSYVLLKGFQRAKIVRYVQMEPYRIARIRSVPDKVDDEEELGRLSRELRRLIDQKTRLSSETPSRGIDLPAEYEDPALLSYLATAMLDLGADLKQDLLETTNSIYRIRHLIDLMNNAICPPGTQN